MSSKSYRIGYHFQRRVVKHLNDKGFNCVVQPKSAFPDIIAWKPFDNGQGGFLALNVQATIEGKSVTKMIFPYFVTMVECKVNKYLSKKEKEEATKILNEGRCNSFMVAWRDGRKLKFQELELKNNLPVIKPAEPPEPRPTPSYFG